MTSESDFQLALDEQPDNHHLRGVLADWLEEQGDPRSAGYRLMGEKQIRPFNAQSWGWVFCCPHPNSWNPYPDHCSLPFWWFVQIRGMSESQWLTYWSTRKQAEDEVAIAYARMPETHKAGMLEMMA